MRRTQITASLVLSLVYSLQAPGLLEAQEAVLDLAVLPEVTITVLADNMSGLATALGEMGASFLIQTDQTQILLDTGRGYTLIGNANAVNVDLGKTDAIVLSHGHTDHTGGLAVALDATGSIDLFLHPLASRTTYWRTGDSYLTLTLPLSQEELRQRVDRIIETEEPTLVRAGLMVTGQIPRRTDFEDTGAVGYAFLDESLETSDPILDDQALFFLTPEGLVIVLGCAHAGLVNTMEYITELTGESRIYAIIGGTHLAGASDERIEKTVDALRRFDVQRIMLSHCTGLRIYAEMVRAFPGRVSWPGAGVRIRFGGQ
jgi:7,8-dihydropterin-6-yl-methyl-4-(beta-D-ribofuranosyl)aminobenzene 5'-phosphate synthase